MSFRIKKLILKINKQFLMRSILTGPGQEEYGNIRHFVVLHTPKTIDLGPPTTQILNIS